MTSSAIEHTFNFISDNNLDADKGGKNTSFATNSALFSQLLATTGVNQVAYNGYNDEFDQTLNMQDAAVTHDATMGEDQQKYKNLGLFDADAAVIESTRDPRKLDDGAKENANRNVSEFLNSKASNNNGNLGVETQISSFGGNDKTLTNTTVNAVDTTRLENAVDAQKAADSQLLQSQRTTLQKFGPTEARPTQAVTAEELPKSRYATSKPETVNITNTTNQKLDGIKVTKIKEDLISQPTSNLTASVALATQTEKSSKPTLENMALLAEDFDAEERTLLTNGNLGRTATHPQADPRQQPSPIVNPNITAKSTRPVNQTQSTLREQSNRQAQFLTNTSVRPDHSPQQSQPTSDPLVSGTASNNNGQQTQRSHQSQTPRPTRPPVPPQEITNQVAVQIKKAIGQGADQIRIQLKPAELGRVEVKLEVNADGHATAIVNAERPETLDLLQRDAAGLRQALQDAGLSTDSNSLSFNLRGEGSRFEREMTEQGHAPQTDSEESANAGNGEETGAEDAAHIAAQIAAADGRINVQV